MLHVVMFVARGLLALLIVISAIAVVVETVNVLAGAAMNVMPIQNHRGPDEQMDWYLRRRPLYGFAWRRHSEKLRKREIKAWTWAD